ncbi:RNA polymerase sigma-70 factor (ECF subfamily) [Pedobacter nutrimenti]|uniref:RNA polymerase sigma-70 factor (ECF subfamily) n=2 Tax=Pedobacter nutrimenti TaxID=1241337 RepID=A0A318UHQ1_9SPHI|nr:RNA polymerase sigma-70 factor (ECF subfamily) [Pedobacter nutrimenti]
MRALEHFYRQYQQAMFQFLKAYCRDASVVTEMIQDAFLQLWENRAKINEQQNVKNLLFTISKHKVIDQLRKSQQREKILKLKYKPQEEVFSTLDQVILADYQRLLSSALMQLPERNREVYSLSRNTHLSNAEISSRLNISVKAVEKHITKTLRFLKVFLQKEQVLIFFLLLHSILF